MVVKRCEAVYSVVDVEALVYLGLRGCDEH